MRATFIVFSIFIIFMTVLYALFGWNRGQDVEGMGLMFYYLVTISFALPLSVILLCFVAISLSRAIKILLIHQINFDTPKKIRMIILGNIITGLVLALIIYYEGRMMFVISTIGSR